MTTTTDLIPCPVEGCLTFPFPAQSDVDEHVASGQHVMTISSPARRRFETVDNGFGGTTTRKVEPVVPPTPKQTAFLRSLLAERTGVLAAEEVRATLNQAREAGTLSKRIVSQAIDALLKIERTPVERADVVPATTPAAFAPSKGSMSHDVLRAIPHGKYLVDGAFFQVDRPERGNWAGFVFVKLIEAESYAEKRKVASSNPSAKAARVDEMFRSQIEAMAANPAEYAAAFGKKTEHCSFCGRPLSDEGENRSLAVGYGPVCADKYGLPWG